MNDWVERLYNVITSPEYRAAEKEIAMSHPSPTGDYGMTEKQWAEWQQGDEQIAFHRCVELVQKALGSGSFNKQDIEDLIYHLGVKEYYK